MDRRCFIPCCKNTTSKNGEKVWMFDVTDDRLKEWGAVVPRTGRTLRINDRLCQKHFFEDQIMREVKTIDDLCSLEVKRLEKGAIPSLWPNCPNITKKCCSRQNHEYILIKTENLYDDFSQSIKTEQGEENEYDSIKEETLDSESSSGREFYNPESPEIMDFKEEKVKVGYLSECAEDNVEDISAYPTLLETMNYEHPTPTTLFEQLQDNLVLLTLPTASWILHHVSKTLLVMMKIVMIESDAIVEKKILLSDNFLKLFIFQHLHETFCDESLKNIKTIEQLQNIIKNFDQLPVCYGFKISKNVTNFKHALYQEDIWIKSLRHLKCNYLLEDKTRTECCKLCSGAKRALCRFRNITKFVKSKKSSPMKQYRNVIRREERLKLRLELLKKDLVKAKGELREDLTKKTENVGSLHSAQRSLIKECINMCKLDIMVENEAECGSDGEFCEEKVKKSSCLQKFTISN